MLAINGLFFPMLGTVTFVTLMIMSFSGINYSNVLNKQHYNFVTRNGHQLMLDGNPFYINGWNSYWLMDHAVDEFDKPKVKEMLLAGSKMGLTVCRTWAFNDGSYHALQVKPGLFDEEVFKALDYVIAEARRNGVRLILSLVNNLNAYGGKAQYVKWAWDEGLGISSADDSFFFDPSIQTYFKDYIKAVLTRKNTITGIEYRDDPIILGWELINEPRCRSDPSGDTLHEWIKEMSKFIKEIDEKHLVTVGLEGFYDSNNTKSALNPSEWTGAIGSDFIRNNDIPTIDFASVHVYPDQWLSVENLEEKLEFVRKWLLTHIEDGDKRLNKPVVLTEFGLSSHNKDFDPLHRDRLNKLVYDIIYKSAKRNKAGAGALFWQFFVKGMEGYHDDFGMVPWENPSTFETIVGQSCRLARLRGHSTLKGSFKDLCQQIR